jgi:hypothetical protein
VIAVGSDPRFPDDDKSHQEILLGGVHSQIGLVFMDCACNSTASSTASSMEAMRQHLWRMEDLPGWTKVAAWG